MDSGRRSGNFLARMSISSEMLAPLLRDMASMIVVQTPLRWVSGGRGLSGTIMDLDDFGMLKTPTVELKPRNKLSALVPWFG